VESTNRSSILVIGIGNEMRGDDGVGLLVARNIADACLSNVVVKTLSGDSTQLFQLWEGFSNVIVIDAVDAHATPGKRFTISASTSLLFRGLFSKSSHLFGVIDAIELAKELENLPPQFIFYGIQIKSVELTEDISDSVRKSAQELSDYIIENLKRSISMES